MVRRWPLRSVEPCRGRHGARRGRGVPRRRARLRVAAGRSATGRLVAHVLPVERSDRGTAPRHQRLRIRRDGRVAPLPRDGRRRLPRGRLADDRTRHRFRRRLAAPRRRARLVRRPRRHARPLRVADRVLVGVLQSALCHRLRRASWATNDPTGSSQRVAFGTRSHTGPRDSRRRTSSRWTGTTPSWPARSIR